MTCPICKVDLLISDKHGIEIDYCPKCRGIWLDRGELDKIIERANEYENSLKARDRSNEFKGEEFYKYKDPNYKKYKRKSFFDDLFDF
uniref:Transcription factor zinc-finger domain-containing protein n=1 Tax=Ignavibacterium album TaxID=591197 RepID=A0A7V2ZMM7_9BACT